MRKLGNDFLQQRGEIDDVADSRQLQNKQQKLQYLNVLLGDDLHDDLRDHVHIFY